MKKLIPFLALVLFIPTAHAASLAVVPAQVIMHFAGNAKNSVDGFKFNTVGAPKFETELNRYTVNFGNNNSKNIIEADYPYGADGGDISMGAWVKINKQITKENQAYTFIMQSSNVSKVRYSLAYSYANGIWMACFNRNAVGNSQLNTCSAVNWQPGEWHHLIGTRSGQDSFLYVDGVQTSHNTTSVVNGTADVWNEVSFGALHYTDANHSFYANFASAKMSEAFVATSTISSSTVSAIWNGGFPLTISPFD